MNGHFNGREETRGKPNTVTAEEQLHSANSVRELATCGQQRRGRRRSIESTRCKKEEYSLQAAVLEGNHSIDFLLTVAAQSRR